MSDERSIGDIPSHARAAVTTGHGGPEMLEVRDRWPVPAPSPGSALVAVRAAAVNNTDIWSRLGAYGTAEDPDAIVGWRGAPLDFPRIQGGDIVGSVVAVARDGDRHLLGRRVLVDPAMEYDGDLPVSIVGSEADGGFAEYHVSDIERLHDVTDSPLSDAQLACVPIAYGTAMGMVERSGAAPGERILVTGASGGVGSAAVQILVARECDVVAVTSIEHQSTMREWGAVEVVVRGHDDMAAIEPVDAALDVVGGEGFGTVLDRLVPGGRLVVAGAIAGPVTHVDLRRLYLPQRRIIGSTMHTPEHFADLMDMARRGEIAPVVAQTFPLGDIHSAQETFVEGGFSGKLVITP